MARLYWIRSPQGSGGPYDLAQIRNMVASGQLTPSTQITVDQVRWIDAVDVRGLLPTSSTSKATSEASASAPANTLLEDQNLQIFVERHGHRSGPYSVVQVNALLATGEISPTDLAWHPRLVDWVPVTSIEGASLPKQPSNASPQPQFTNIPTFFAHSEEALPTPPKPENMEQNFVAKKPIRSTLGKIAAIVALTMLIGFLGPRLLKHAHASVIDCADAAVVETATHLIVKTIMKRDYLFVSSAAINSGKSLPANDEENYVNKVREQTDLQLTDIVTFTSSKGVLNCHAVMTFYPLDEPKTDKKSLSKSYTVRVADDNEHFIVEYSK
ncbi:DUF4339 domain-containing protein [Pseudolysobacter antarcticus]|uniref:DUF4339 domain-containing protein n=1 Tax=Pseudolysobacter antarcticus TaxID=2511995 RepID=A0A411HI20_9GAMM|nr:DUF4339 domain-containing protein [Pseudolysobacter antarcticus]QBB70169.1 DUF4339 domain-containing protein [Pseudolysobacter antarcticus]